MPFFQNSVITKYLKTIDKQAVSAAYTIFVEHFHNPILQENIRNSKEEQYQEGFLIDLFVEVLGYTKNPKPNFNLTTEYKNVKDAKKADGAIIFNDVVKAVIELKGTETTDLGKIETQAFGYKNNQPECVYVITSNFEKLRFYVDNAIEHVEFNLFALSKEEFELLYLCLACENIEKGIPKQIKNESLSTEDVITKKLYADYSVFRRILFQNIVLLNPQFDKLILFKKTQKLLDRFLFIFFAEDRQLLPPNSIRTILEQFEQLKELDKYTPLYERFKLYFNYMNIGRKGKQYDIFAYNGGLFLADEILDNILIDDSVLFEHTLKLSNYDFDTEIDVDILGHIFEHSLNEIEEIQSEIEGKELDKSKTKRKKDGIFYTPKYITKYIVDNTVGKLCTEKKIDLKINEEDYTSDKTKSKPIKQVLADNLTKYRNWLLQIKICDPACGSGAFLNQALDFLIREHKYIDELYAKLFGASLVLSDIENSILENNLFGVDLNEESVEIAKLSLWLRTARPNRKLNDLNNNIKCGNSLIDDPSVVGDKAFNWFLEFPQVFPHYRNPKPKPEKTEPHIEYPEPGDRDYLDEMQEGAFSYKAKSKGFEKYGFDVVIGNPPYVFTRGNSYFNDIKGYLWKTYPNNQGKINLYGVFLELSLKSLVKINGYLGFIAPETFIRTSTYQEMRKFIYKNYNISRIELFGNGVFENVTAESIIMIVVKDFSINNEIFFRSLDFGNTKEFRVKQKYFDSTPQNRFVYDSTNNDEIIFEKLRVDYIALGLIVDTRNGIATKAGKKDFIANNKLTEKYKKLLEAPEIFRYGFNWSGNFINYDKQFLHRPRKEETFLSEKILIQRVSSKLICAFDNEKFFTFNSINNLVLIDPEYNLKFIISLLNSKLINYYYRKQFSFDAGFTITVTKENLDIIPIKNIPLTEQLRFVDKADLMLTFNKQLQELSKKFQRIIKRKFDLNDLSGKLQNWYLFSYKDFLKELSKKKVILKLAEEAEWEEYFQMESTKAIELKKYIEETDKEIDKMVYELYGLTEDEVSIVEGK